MNGATYRIWEQTLVVRCQAGDDDAFAELMGLYEARLRYYVEGLAGRTNDADDILQDVWLDVYLKIHKLRSPKAFRAWLYRIARDKVYAEFRRKKHITLESLEQEIPQEGREEPTFSAEDIERIRASLQKLSHKHREILLLRFLEDMTYEEIAVSLCCQIGTVRSRVYYAKCALRRQMEAES